MRAEIKASGAGHTANSLWSTGRACSGCVSHLHMGVREGTTEGPEKAGYFGPCYLSQHVKHALSNKYKAARIPLQSDVARSPHSWLSSAPAGQSEVAAGGQYCGRILQGQRWGWLTCVISEGS